MASPLEAIHMPLHMRLYISPDWILITGLVNTLIHIYEHHIIIPSIPICSHSFLKAGPEGLINASKEGRLEVVKALLAAGADKEAKDNVSA